MDAALISNWNKVVGDDDEVYHLGDVCLDPKLAFKYMSQLKGKKILILGNHDGPNKNMRSAGFDEVYQSWSIKIGSKRVFMMHRPKPLTGYDAGKWILHGHTHNKTPKIDKPNKMINLSVEHHNYTPVSEPELIRLMH